MRRGSLTVLSIAAAAVFIAVLRPRLTGRAGGAGDNGCGGDVNEDGIEAKAVTEPAKRARPELEPIEVAIEQAVPIDIKRTIHGGIGALHDVAKAKGIARLDQLALEGAFRDEKGIVHTRVQHTYNGVPVFGSELILHQNEDGTLETVTDELLPGVDVAETVPALTASAAIERAKATIPCPSCLTATPLTDLEIIRSGELDRLAYRVSMRREDGTKSSSMPVVFIDARDGELLWMYDNLQTAGGPSLYYGTVKVGDTAAGGGYYLEDTTRKIGTFDFRNGTTSAYRIFDSDGVLDGSTQGAALTAAFVAQSTYDYYFNVHGRAGIDGSGGPGYYTSIDGTTALLSSRVHYSTSYNNAYWNGSAMTYGDGDGVLFGPLVALDIGGHELTHGLIERTAHLTYSGESGALSESFADIFGAMIEARSLGVNSNTWKIGEACYTPGNGNGDAFRYLDDPHAASNGGMTVDDDPDHYSERYTGAADNGGVHTNAGIGNKAFYLLSVGGTHHLGGSMTGIGILDAEKIWYKALTSYMTSSTNYAGARTATLNAASALFGASSAQYSAAGEAWCLVGVGTCSGPSPAPSTELITNGGFEGSLSGWMPSGTGVYYANIGSYPHGGTGYIFLGNASSVSGQIYQTVTIPSTATSANLTFYLNVTTNETTTTTQYDRLYIEVRNGLGLLMSTLATFSNLTSAAPGAYMVRGPFSLLAYRGQTIRVQLRVTNDASASTIFRVDDVSVQ